MKRPNITKGDFAGHPFRGNQHTGGIYHGSSGTLKGKRPKAKPSKNRRRIPEKGEMTESQRRAYDKFNQKYGGAVRKPSVAGPKGGSPELQEFVARTTSGPGKTLSQSEASKVYRKYLELEDINYHSENYEMLAQSYGTAKELARLKEIKAIRDKKGSLTNDLVREQNEIGRNHYKKLLQDMGPEAKATQEKKFDEDRAKLERSGKRTYTPGEFDKDPLLEVIETASQAPPKGKKLDNYGARRARKRSQMNEAINTGKGRTVISRDSATKLQAKYKKLTNANNHNEAAIALAEKYGSQNDIKRLKDVKDRSNKAGETSQSDIDERNSIVRNYFEYMRADAQGLVKKKIAKGDFAGHPFRGNQHTGGIYHGASGRKGYRKAGSGRGAKKHPPVASGRLGKPVAHRDMKSWRMKQGAELKAQAEERYEQESRKELMADAGMLGSATWNNPDMYSKDQLMVLSKVIATTQALDENAMQMDDALERIKSSKKPSSRDLETAERALKSAEWDKNVFQTESGLGEDFSDATADAGSSYKKRMPEGTSKEYMEMIEAGRSAIRSLGVAEQNEQESRDALREALDQAKATPQAIRRVNRRLRKGDFPGHPFRGNQYTGGKFSNASEAPGGSSRQVGLSAKRKKLIDGKNVTVASAKDAYELIDFMHDQANKAASAGKDAKGFDLCKVTVPGTNLFCGSNKGIERAKMPQLGGHEKKFVKMLGARGVKVQDKTVKAKDLKATQNELLGTKVASMMNNKNFDPEGERILVSKDGYVVDGHHRWATQIGRDSSDGRLGDKPMKVTMIDMPITELIKEANSYADSQGLERKSGKDTGADVKKAQPTPSDVHVDGILKFPKRKKKDKKLEELMITKRSGGLSRWFKEDWVDISRPKEGGGFEPCGRSDASSGKYPKCVPASKAAKMTPEQIRSAVSRKRKAESSQKREGKKPINVSTFKKGQKMASKNIPTKPKLYAQVKSEAKRKFDVYPSAYANGWLVREYKKRGGGYKTVSKSEDITKQIKDPKGGLTAEGRAHFKRKEGANLKPGVKGAADTPEKMRRKGSFLTRFFTNPSGPMTKPNGKPSRLALSASAWGEPVPKNRSDAAKLAAKGRRMLERYQNTKKK